MMGKRLKFMPQMRRNSMCINRIGFAAALIVTGLGAFVLGNAFVGLGGLVAGAMTLVINDEE